MKKLLQQTTFVLVFFLVIGFTKQIAFADTVEVNEENFPDENLRNAIIDYIDIVESGEDADSFDENNSFDVADEEEEAEEDEAEDADEDEDIDEDEDSEDVDDATNDSDEDSDDVYTVDTSKVSTLNLNEVSNFKGLELFTGLKNLTITSSTSSEIDLSKLSGIKNLGIYSCTKLTKINLGKNDIETLYIKNCSKLSSINISKLTKLAYADFTGCALKKIDVSKNKALVSLNLTDNKKLSKLNLKNNKKLTQLSISGTKVKKLDLKKFKKLKLYYFNISKGSKIDLSKIVGSNCKLDAKADTGLSFKKGKLITSKKCSDSTVSCTLKIGKCTYTISISFK